VKETTLRLIQTHCRRGILVDTNLLLLYFVGLLDRNQVQRFKRTQQYTAGDHQTLVALLKRFDKVVTTPNILTEVSNLSGQLGEPLRSRYFSAFAREISLLTEHYIESTRLAEAEHFVPFGLADTAILSLGAAGHLVLTDDSPLTQRLQKIGADVINFNHIRTLAWS
jgi:rRNA-processing protein FCF1